MKSLLIMRHAKSSWDDPSLDDHDRPLNARGQRDAPKMGSFLCDQGLIPNVILSSTAVRARMTAEMVAESCNISNRLSYTPGLYHASADEWTDELRQLPEDSDTALCIGHNPGLEDFLATSVGQHVVMPTAAIAHVKFDQPDWGISPNKGRLISVWRPKELPAE